MNPSIEHRLDKDRNHLLHRRHHYQYLHYDHHNHHNHHLEFLQFDQLDISHLNLGSRRYHHLNPQKNLYNHRHHDHLEEMISNWTLQIDISPVHHKRHLNHHHSNRHYLQDLF